MIGPECWAIPRPHLQTEPLFILNLTAIEFIAKHLADTRDGNSCPPQGLEHTVLRKTNNTQFTGRSMGVEGEPQGEDVANGHRIRPRHSS